MADEIQRLDLVVHGRVQGVGYRYSVLDVARRLGLRGWVRNTDDGDVELSAEGDVAALQRLLNWCRSGPPGARVTRVDEQWKPAAGDLSDFHIRR